MTWNDERLFHWRKIRHNLKGVPWKLEEILWEVRFLPRIPTVSGFSTILFVESERQFKMWTSLSDGYGKSVSKIESVSNKNYFSLQSFFFKNSGSCDYQQPEKTHCKNVKCWKKFCNQKNFFRDVKPLQSNHSEKFTLLFLVLFMMRKFQCSIFGRRIHLKFCFSKVTADFNSLGECCLAFRLNCTFAQDIYAARHPKRKLFSQFQKQIIQSC